MVVNFGPFHSIVAHSFGAAAICLLLERTPALTPHRLSLISPMHGLDQHIDVFADIASLSPARSQRLRQRVAGLVGTPTEEICAVRAARTLKVSSLVIHDRHDPVIPHNVGETLAGIIWPKARFITTSRLGHRRVLRCPTVLEEVLTHHRSH